MNHFTKLFLLFIGLALSGCVVEPVHPYHPYYHDYYYDPVDEPVYYDPVIYPYWGWGGSYRHHHWR
jgi:hypothetical protein